MTSDDPLVLVVEIFCKSNSKIDYHSECSKSFCSIFSIFMIKHTSRVSPFAKTHSVRRNFNTFHKILNSEEVVNPAVSFLPKETGQNRRIADKLKLISRKL